jgi:hypothetical protein
MIICDSCGTPIRKNKVKNLPTPGRSYERHKARWLELSEQELELFG